MNYSEKMEVLNIFFSILAKNINNIRPGVVDEIEETKNSGESAFG
jgi:hypothetical protein